MDNEAPNYASWIPEAGGYVANGNVVSKSPVYDDQGKLKLDIDASLFNQSKPQTANTIQGNNGITTANIAGSKTDANSMMTNIGSGASLNLNTANPDESVLSTPAAKSTIAEQPILTPADKAMKDIQDAAGRNDIQGMINGYVELGEAEGKDYSTTIDRLTKQREQKIMNTDDQYLYQYQQAKQAYDMAVRSGDPNAIAQAEANMNNILAQQQAWRDAVGYQSAMQNSYQREEQALQLRWENMYMDGINQIANSITQLVGGYLNFQYDPTTDAALRIAQGYVASSVKEQAISTGTFGSSFMQSAIAKATAELVPVYEKMAKDEMKEQISMLQSTASFLMDLEQTQFNMWKSQIELQWDANNEKRKQVQAAIDSANARGYYTNEEAALVGVEPGSQSQQAREHEQELLEELDREQRALDQKKALARYENDMAIELAKEQAKLADWKTQREYQYKDWYNKNDHIYDATYSNGSQSGRTDGIKVTQVTDNGDGTKTTTEFTAYPDGYGGYVDASGNPVSVSSTTTGDNDVWSSIGRLYGTGVANTIKDTYALLNVGSEDFSEAGNVTEFSEALKKDVQAAQDAILNQNVNALKDVTNPNQSSNLVGPTKNMTATVDITPYLEGTYLQKAKETIAKNTNDYGGKESQTKEAIGNSTKSIINMVGDMERNGADQTRLAATADAMFTELFDSIKNGGDKFDYPKYANSKSNVVDIQDLNGKIDAFDVTNEGNKAKEDAMIAIIQDVINTKELSADIKYAIAYNLSNKAWEFAKDIDKKGTALSDKGYAGLVDKGSWRYLAPNSVSKLDYSNMGTSTAPTTKDEVVNKVKNAAGGYVKDLWNDLNPF